MVSSFVLFRSTAGLCSANGEGWQTIGSTHKGAEARDGGSASGEFVHGSDLSAVGGFEVIRKEAEVQNQGFRRRARDAWLDCRNSIPSRTVQLSNDSDEFLDILKRYWQDPVAIDLDVKINIFSAIPRMRKDQKLLQA